MDLWDRSTMPAPKELDPEASLWHLFGAYLRFLRTANGETQSRLGNRLHSTGSFVGQIETGERTPSPEFAAQLDAATGATKLLIATASHARKLTPDPKEWFESFAETERAATRIRTFQPQVIPGLLQCEEYIRELLKRARVPAARAEMWVERRLARRRLLLASEPPEYWAIVDEAALLRLMRNPEVAKPQLLLMLDMIERENVVLEMVPIDVGLHPCMDGAFVLFTVPGKGECTYAEDMSEGRMTTNAQTVAEVQRRYDLLRSDTLAPARTERHLRDLLEGTE
ncbi:helix-turn-helix domain-containing protein [Yinghuangia seranimata]|uniref:helix-turn-helix domain-containing protein n=1 Tax=Yinghuangia seranimata TaxID=408067 RepID=UPI00248B76CA|nr:helix-turn-helix transcriptional regulator [Yinghuangia seranimata]MDI2131855.1 helix-turn-helix transcriptional regulator [Yinghuangia seranimata]